MKRQTGKARSTASRLWRAAPLLAVLAPPMLGAETAPTTTGGPRHVTVEAIRGTNTSRVTLSARAAERLGIRLGTVSEGVIPQTQTVGGIVMRPAGATPKNEGGGDAMAWAPVAHGSAVTARAGSVSTDASAESPADAARRAGEELWVRVSLSAAEWERVATDRPARIAALPGRALFPGNLSARPSGLPPVEDARRSMLWVHYVLAAGVHGLEPGERVRVELERAGNGKVERFVPYSAVYYDANGSAWVYASVAALTYVRQRVAVERIVGDQAVMADGPPVGTSVVTVGAALLYGAELLGK